MEIWQERRLVSVVPSANWIRSLSMPPSSGGPTRSIQARSTWTWHVAQAQTPPQSPSIPGTLLNRAASRALSPSSISTVRRVPSAETKVTLIISMFRISSEIRALVHVELHRQPGDPAHQIRQSPLGFADTFDEAVRSEERRVGKECGNTGN